MRQYVISTSQGYHMSPFSSDYSTRSPRAHPLALLLPLIFAIALPASAALPSNAEVEAILKQHLIANNKAKGVAVALVDASGIRVVTAGVARGNEAVKPDDVFEIGSVTKTFAALLLAIADEKNEAKLDDAVEKFLPDGIKLRDSAGAPIRMVDLATQRSGLPRLATNMQPKEPKNPYADYTERDLLDFIKTFTPTRARNAQYEYSNIGFGLLGYVLTRAAKAESFEALLSTRILKPLNMTGTSSDPKRNAERMVQPHDANGRPTPAWDIAAAHAAAGAIRSNAGDMGRYAEAIAGLKTTPLSNAITLATTTREQGPGRINPIGLAWMRLPFNERAFMNHDGGTFGSSSSLMVDQGTKEAVFIVTNQSTPLMDLALHLLDRRHSIAPREFPKVVAVAEETLARYAGSYKVNDEMSIVVRVNGGKVTAQATRQGEFEIFPESETRFFAKVAPIVMTFGDVGEGKAADAKAGSFVIEQGGSKITARRIP
jgi:serine-type D-Ala-D-Ala carboxypeptidase/endopeptidase